MGWWKKQEVNYPNTTHLAYTLKAIDKEQAAAGAHHIDLISFEAVYSDLHVVQL